jgi:hypothetical protein
MYVKNLGQSENTGAPPPEPAFSNNTGIVMVALGLLIVFATRGTRKREAAREARRARK